MDLQTFIEKTRWTRASNYSGPDLSDWCEGPSQGRDSGILAQSNFATALEQLGGEQEGIVEVHRFSCWLGGWFETIFVNPKNSKAIKTLKSIAEALEYYPVLDDIDYSEREYERQEDDFKYYQSDFIKAVLKFCGFDDTDPEFSSLIEDADVTAIAKALFSDACRYYGTEEAYLSVENIDKVACKHNLKHLAETNACAELVLACMGEG